MKTLHVYPSKSQEEALIAFLNERGISYSKDEILPPHVVAGINAGLEDVKAGRTITLEEFIAQRKKV